MVQHRRCYCPYKDCLGLIEKENDGCGDDMTETECPYCRRRVCVRCNSTWHSGIGCDKLPDEKLHRLAKGMQWKRCPDYKLYVDRTSGCSFIHCRERNCDELVAAAGCGLKFCGHKFCSHCLTWHVATILKSKRDPTVWLYINDQLKLNCPVDRCDGFIDGGACSGVLPEKMVAQWEDAACVTRIPLWRRFYCPYSDCAALIEKDCDEGEVDEWDMTTEAECPYCRRKMCVWCNVPWHSGVGCSEFIDSLDEDEVELRRLAKAKRWQRCPDCKLFVDRADGCDHIRCK
ncbi:E3 ubiquitin-protein ligase RSL1-like [Andrographis paniculata]|uniref:E3 ubiquitin-protein ligase RSL1-like n=1 Tax=Andrographis paniculata TaxID=175694 RepID=UPI0021E6FD90|nr:E3 ubiquitin-protein ligase RSL1-like [Andrographis paniculata]